MTRDSWETEWQLDAVDLRPVMRWLAESDGWLDAAPLRVTTAGSVSLVDLYVDTDDQRLHRAGYALRLRRAGRRLTEATLKSLESPQGSDGLRRRLEISEPLELADLEVLMGSEGPVGARVRAIVGVRRLVSLFEVRTRRRLFSLQSDTTSAGEIALDETAIHLAAGGPPARLRRVEVEASGPAAASLYSFVERLVEACALRPATLSKYEAGRLSAGLAPPPVLSFGPTAVDLDASIRAVALAVLRRHFAMMLAKEPGTRLGEDTEELHDMRVAARRLRAALSLFAGVLPATVRNVGAELVWLGRTLGAVRDLDVQLEQLDLWLTEIPEPDRAALAGLRKLLESQHDAARKEMLAAFDSRRYEVLVGRFARTLRARHEGRSGLAAQPARAIAPDLIEDRYRRFRKAANAIRPGSPPSEYHRLRARGKRARYTIEFLADLYPGQTGPVLKPLVALQDILGLHQDADVAIERLRRLGSSERGLSPETVFAMGEFAGRYRHAMVDLRGQFPEAYEETTGRRWKRFRKTIDAGRPSPQPRRRSASAPVEEGLA